MIKYAISSWPISSLINVISWCLIRFYKWFNWVDIQKKERRIYHSALQRNIVKISAVQLRNYKNMEVLQNLSSVCHMIDLFTMHIGMQQEALIGFRHIKGEHPLHNVLMSCVLIRKLPGGSIARSALVKYATSVLYVQTPLKHMW